MQKLSIHFVCVLKNSHWYIFHPCYILISPVLWYKCQSVFNKLHLSKASWEIWLYDDQLILIAMDNNWGHYAWWKSCKVPKPNPQRIFIKWKMYAIKQIKICAEYRYMPPRHRLVLSHTSGLRPIPVFCTDLNMHILTENLSMIQRSAKVTCSIQNERENQGAETSQ